ncbi:MAG: ABC transporter substrate-binding protein, partial [Dongiaceae bacterium]
MKKLSSLLIVLLITGCSYVQTVKNWWEPTPPAAQMMPSKIKIGYVPVLVSAPLFVAQEEGWIAAEKLDVELVRYGSGAQLNQGVLAGDVDVVIAPITTSLVAKSSGVEFPAVAALGEQQMVFVARGEFATLFKNKNFKQAAEELQHLALRKPKIGTFLRGGITDIVTRKWLAQTQGMSEDDVEIIYFNVDQMEQAFMAGNIDAAIVWEPMRQILNQKAQGIYIIAQGEELYPRQAGVVMMVSRNMIQKHP